MPSESPDRVLIFDTTLRDGEQSPGISLNTTEKLEIAHQLARLGVDIIEAGFPIASPGDFEAVQAIAREVHGPVIAGLARANPADVERAWEAVRDAERPRIHTFVSTSDIHIVHQLQSTREDVKGLARASVAQAREFCEDVEFSPMDATRADLEFTAEVVQIALDEGATTINIPDTVGYAMPQEYAAFLTQPLRARARPARRGALGALPRRPRAGGGQLVRRRAGRRAPGRVRDQRHRRARGQRVARGDRDAPAHAPGRRRAEHRRRHPRDRALEPPRQPPDRLSRAAQQGDRRAQRLRPRVGHPPGRDPQGALDLRDHGRHHGRAGRQPARAGQALRPPRAARGAGGAGLSGRRPGPQHRLQALQGAGGQEEAGHRDGPRGARHRRAARGARRLHAGVVRRRGLLAPPAARHRRRAHARRRRGPGLVHRRRPDRRGLPRHQRRDRARRPPARVPRRRGHRRPGRARRGLGRRRAGGQRAASASACPACSCASAPPAPARR